MELRGHSTQAPGGSISLGIDSAVTSFPWNSECFSRWLSLDKPRL